MAATTITGPERAHGVNSPDAYEQRQRAAARQLGVLIHPAKVRAEAYVNHGRWVCDCSECGAGVSVSLAWGIARCLECGAVYDASSGTLRLPDDDTVTSVADALLERPESRTRNWRPSETAADLRIETAVLLDVVQEQVGV